MKKYLSIFFSAKSCQITRTNTAEVHRIKSPCSSSKSSITKSNANNSGNEYYLYSNRKNNVDIRNLR